MKSHSAGNSLATGAKNGMVLLLCLIFLVALTLLGLSASSDVILQNRLAANLQDSERAKQSALAALAWAEDWLLKIAGPPPEGCSSPCEGLYIHTAGELPPHPENEDFAWWSQHGLEAGIDPLTGERITTITGDSFDAPTWIIETAQVIPAAESESGELQAWYRLLARGSGQTDNTVSVIESIIARSWPATDESGPGDTTGLADCPGTTHPEICGRFAWRELR